MSSALKKGLFAGAEWLLALRPQRFAVLSPREDLLAKRLNRRRERILVPNVPTVPIRRSARPATAASIIMVGRISVQKDPSFFLSTLRAVRREVPGVQAVWVGDGDPTGRRALQAEGVRVTGWVPSERLISELDSASVYVHSAAYEGFPLSVLDAAARGLPVVARAIHAFSGSTVAQYETVDSIATAVSQLLVDGPHKDRASARNDSLLDQMSERRQREQLKRLYEPPAAGYPAPASVLGAGDHHGEDERLSTLAPRPNPSGLRDGRTRLRNAIGATSLMQDLRANLEGRDGSASVAATVLTTRFLATFLFRVSQALGRKRLIFPAGIVKQFNQVITGADLAWQASVGPGLVLYHPVGVVIGPDCVIGRSAVLQQGVTIGGTGRPRSGNTSPTLGDEVFVGAGARVIGPCEIGSRARIGANAVVVKDVPVGAVAVGVPAAWRYPS
nr:glycosyltransferase [Curtobacterium sp. MCBD17_030]